MTGSARRRRRRLCWNARGCSARAVHRVSPVSLCVGLERLFCLYVSLGSCVSWPCSGLCVNSNICVLLCLVCSCSHAFFLLFSFGLGDRQFWFGWQGRPVWGAFAGPFVCPFHSVPCRHFVLWPCVLVGWVWEQFAQPQPSSLLYCQTCISVIHHVLQSTLCAVALGCDSIPHPVISCICAWRCPTPLTL